MKFITYLFIIFFIFISRKSQNNSFPLSYNADPFFSRRDGNYSDPYFREIGKMQGGYLRFFFKNRGV